MRSWVSCAGLVAAGLTLAAVVNGCGENSFSDCTSNGTCPPDAQTDGAGGENVLVEAAGGSSSGAGDGATDSSTDGPGVDATDGAILLAGGVIAPVREAAQ